MQLFHIQLGRFVAPLNVRSTVHHVGLVLQILGVLLLPPAIVAFIAQEFVLGGLFVGLAAGSYFVGRFAAMVQQADLGLKEALVVTALAYPLFSLISAVAFSPVVPYLDGLFEAMSGFTTTGLSVLDLSRDLPQGLLFFRAYSQWIGGAGIIILSIAVLLGPRRATFHLYASEFGAESVAGSVRATARIVLRVYLVLTAIAIALLLAAGMGPWDALLHGLAGISTGGFSPYADSLGHFGGVWVPLASVLIMVLGAVSFPLYYLVYREGPRRLLRDPQVRLLLVLFALGALLALVSSRWLVDAVIPSVFHAATALTGTGFSLTSPADWPAPTRMVTATLMFIGGGAGSTTGGIKLFRVLLVFSVISWVMARRLLPEEATLPIRFQGQVVDDREFKDLLGFLALYLAVFIAGAIALTFDGAAMQDALFESASALGTVGLSTGIVGPDMVAWGKALIIVEMWLGRLEILPVLVLLQPALYRWRRRSA